MAISTVLTGTTGSGSGVGGTDIMSADTSDSAVLSGYTQTGLEIVSSPVMHGAQSFRLQHSSSVKSFKKVVAVDKKFRGKNVTLYLDVFSSATSGNLNLLVSDETNVATLAASQPIATNSQSITATIASTVSMVVDAYTFSLLKVGMLVTSSAIPVGTVITALSVATLTATLSQSATGSASSVRISDIVNKKTFSFDVPANCASLSWTISSVVEANTESYVDDIVLQLTVNVLSNTSASFIQTQPTVQKLTSGTGATYTTPSGVNYIRVRMVGGGGSGANGTSYPATGTGGTTTFGTSLLTANGGTGGSGTNNGQGGTGGSATISSPAIGTALAGSYGTGGAISAATNYIPGGSGGSSPFGGAGVSANQSSGGAALANTGSGGGGASGVNVAGGGGGGAGGYIDAIITSPLSSYLYTIGAGSAAAGGGSGGSGYIEVTEYYSVPALSIPLTTAQLVQTADSYLQINNFSAATASTNTKILYLTTPTIVSNVGSAIQYISDSVFGDRFIALQEGIYSFNINANAITTSSAFGLTKNTTQPTTIYSTLANTSEKLMMSNVSTSNTISIGWTGKLLVGDIVRLHDLNTAGLNTPAYNEFSISFQGSLKQLNPSSDAKITIPTHSLRFEGASSRGTGSDTAIVLFTSQVKTQGDAFSVVNTAATGTVITVNKSGTLNISTSLQGTNLDVQITKNQTTRTSISSIAAEILAEVAYNVNLNNGYSASYSGIVNAGDIIRVASASVPSAGANNSLNLSLTENSIAANFSNVLPQWSQTDTFFEVANPAMASTNPFICYFSNTNNAIGSDVLLGGDATQGSYYQILTSGTYDVGLDFQNWSGGAQDIYATVTKNAAQLTQQAISVANAPSIQMEVLLGTATGVTNATRGTISRQLYLQAGDILRTHLGTNNGSTITNGGGSTNSKFSISKVGKPNVASVDVTPFVNMKTTDVEAIEALTATSTFGSTNTGVPVLNITKNTNLGVIQVVSDALNGTSFKALKDCTVQMSMGGYASGAQVNLFITKNSTALLIGSSITPATGAVKQVTTPGAGSVSNINTELKVFAGDILRVQSTVAGSITQYVTLLATADNGAIATTTQQVSSDTMAFAFKATAIDPNVDAIGTFNTYYYATGSNATQTLAATTPTQTVSDMNTNGVKVYARNYPGTSSAALPSRFDIFIGKGLKSHQVDAYSGTIKTLPFFYEGLGYGTSEFGTLVHYNETTGILQFNGGTANSSSQTNKYLGNDVLGNSPTSGYFVFNASKTPSLVTIPQQTTKWQKKNSTLALNATGYITDLAFNNLTIGKTYRITSMFRYTLSGVLDPGSIISAYNATTLTNLIASTYQSPAGGTNYVTNSINCVFTAVDTNLRFYYTDSSSENLTGSDTFVIVEELPSHTQTTQWT